VDSCWPIVAPYCGAIYHFVVQNGALVVYVGSRESYNCYLLKIVVSDLKRGFSVRERKI